ncbi:MAG: hypothetical protein JWQ89_737 [Devosia sp.]|uniref:SH3 domain-containing protein n=1 Tax=Devosia sp. TaxID=1871048 RepID=UPI00262EEA0A|nr:SH3 domain-containing protein [Devosia sp.]MDB5539010.1 hypothetical protein [Devosia sp.]
MSPRSSFIVAVGATLLSLGVLAAAPGVYAADNVTVIMVALDYGAAPTIAEGKIRGHGSIDYTFSGKAEQVLDASLTPETVYFDVLQQGAEEAMYVGSAQGNSLSAALPADGTYVVRVYQTGAAADRNDTSKFELTLSLSDAGDGNAGVPEFLAVTGLKAGAMLNVRSEPSTRGSVVAHIPNETLLRNLGCEGSGQTRWCQVRGVEGAEIEGWVTGRFLRETGPDGK